VHYPTDIAAGMALGGSWAFLLAGVFSVARRNGLLHGDHCGSHALESSAVDDQKSVK
jgi:membrane-associated phospholipid phosphatase